MMKERKNNKGFTLVEMIIVIAVMSIITVVAAPQLIGYIEKSNRGTDRQAVWEMAHAAQIAYVASEDLQNPDGSDDNNVIVTISKDDGTFGYRAEPLDNEVSDVIPTTSYKFKSKLYRDHNIEITIDADGNIFITALSAVNDAMTALGIRKTELNEEKDRLATSKIIYDEANTLKAQYDQEILDAEAKIAEWEEKYGMTQEDKQRLLDESTTRVNNYTTSINNLTDETNALIATNPTLYNAKKAVDEAQANLDEYTGEKNYYRNPEYKALVDAKSSREWNYTKAALGADTSVLTTILANETQIAGLKVAKETEVGIQSALQSDVSVFTPLNDAIDAAKQESDRLQGVMNGIGSDINERVETNANALKDLETQEDALEAKGELAKELNDHIHEVTGTSAGEE